MKIHELKITPSFFEDVVYDRKKFEVRKNDRGYKIGDYLCLREYDTEYQVYTGREVVVKVIYMLENFVTLYFEEHYLMIVETTKRKSRCFYLGLPDHLMSVIFNNFREGSFLIVDNSVSRITYNFILTNRKNWGKVIIRAID